MYSENSLLINSNRIKFGIPLIQIKEYAVFMIYFTKLLSKHILCTISLAISYVPHLVCAHLCAVPTNFNCNDENRI